MYLYIRFLIYASGITGLVVATLLGILALFAPCQPLLLSSILCRDGIFLDAKSSTWIVRMLYATAEFVMTLNIGITAIHCCIEILLKGVATLWIDGKDFVKRHGQKLAKIGEYQKLGIFEKCLNACTRSRIFFASALGIPAAQIVLCYMAIKLFRSNENDEYKASLFLWVYFMVLFFTMILFSGAAKINNLSRDWIVSCKWDFKKKYERAVHESLAPLRLEYGNNFVERLTPLVVQEFCMRQTISGLLVA